jgi:hypothetical protein
MAELHLYEVPHRNHIATLKLTAEDAEMIYGDRAKKVGDVEPAEPQPVQRPPWAVEVDETGAPVENDENADEVPEKRAAPARNKARHTK